MTVSRSLCRSGAAAALMLILLLPARAGLADADSEAAKMWQLLKDSGYAFVRKNDSVWYVEEQGKTLGDFKLIGACGDGLLVMFVIIAEKDRLNDLPQITYRMARMNHDMDSVKVGIDGDGDAFVRTDLVLRTLDAQELKDQIGQLAAASDEAYGDIQPYLKPAQQP